MSPINELRLAKREIENLNFVDKQQELRFHFCVNVAKGNFLIFCA